MPPHSLIDHTDDSSTMKDDDMSNHPLQLLEMELEHHHHDEYDNDSDDGHHHGDPVNHGRNDDVTKEEEFEDVILEDCSNAWNCNDTDDIKVLPLIRAPIIDYSSDTEEQHEEEEERVCFQPTTASTKVSSSRNSSSLLSITVPPKFAFALPVKKRKNIRKSVTFDAIKIREYTQVLGDHPCCTFGPPISLGWEYVQNDTKSLDDYEATRRRRRSRRELRLSWDVRRAKLSEFDSDVTNGEVRAVQRKIFRERCSTTAGNNSTKAFFMSTTTTTTTPEPIVITE